MRDPLYCSCSFSFFKDTAPTEIYTLSLHDALPISQEDRADRHAPPRDRDDGDRLHTPADQLAFRMLQADRKSTRLNSSHTVISYAVFCLKKKKRNIKCSLQTRERTDDHVDLHATTA